MITAVQTGELEPEQVPGQELGPVQELQQEPGR